MLYRPCVAIGLFVILSGLAAVACTEAGGGGGSHSQQAALQPDALEPNDLLATATPISTDFEAAGLTLDTATDEDLFVFDVAGDVLASIDVVFERTRGDYLLQLLDAAGAPVASVSALQGDAGLEEILPDGRFVVRVVSTSGAVSRYDISIQAVGAPPFLPDLFEPNDTPATCEDLGQLPTSGPLPTWAGSPLNIQHALDEDFYCFDLVGGPSTVMVDLLFPHAQGNLDLQLFDASLAILTFASSFTDDERLIAEGLPDGRYLLRVFAASRDANRYDLLIHVFTPDVNEPNDTSGACTPLSVPPAHNQFGLSIHGRLDVDWFCFTLPNRGADWQVSLDIFFRHAVGDLDMDIWDAQGNLIAFAQSKDDNEYLDLLLPAGDYSLRVFPFIGPSGRFSPNGYDLAVVAQ